MAEKMKEEAKKKSLVVATVLEDLLFVEKLPGKRQLPLLYSLKEKKVKEGKSIEVAKLDAKIINLSKIDILTVND